MYDGNLVRLRDLREEDMKIDFEHFKDLDLVLNKRTGIPYPITWEAQKSWYQSQSKPREDYHFSIETIDGNEYLGGCGVDKFDWKNGFVTVYIYIANKDYRGKGYGTDAMKVFLNFLFNQTNVNKVQLEVFSFNKRGIKSYKKNGFIEEGRIRERLFRNGKYHDVVIMGLLRREYESVRK